MMKAFIKKHRWVFYAGLIFIILIIFFIIGISKFRDGFCGNQIINKYPSFSGKKVITENILNCGATTDFVTSLSDSKNYAIISIKGAHGDNLSVKWVDENNVIINYIGDPELIYSYKNKISDTNFVYKNNDKFLDIKCLYYECEKISREKEITRRREWCNYSKENREYCNKEENKGWENCGDYSWCHYDGPNK